MGRKAFVATFLAPAGTLFALFVVFPLSQAIWGSFHRWSGLSDVRTFTGVENFARLWKDKVFLQTLTNGLWLFVVVGLSTLILALVLAYSLNSRTRLATQVRAIFLFPHVMSMVAVAVLWRFILDPTPGGLVNGTFNMQASWLGDKSLALPSVGAAFAWYSLGFYVLLFLAALEQQEPSAAEAAELDGASPSQKFRFVSWPLLWPVRRVALLHMALAVANLFGLVWVMTQGGPDRATETPLTYLYQAGFVESRFGYAAAISTANLILILAFLGLLTLLQGRNPAPEGGH